MKTCQRRRYHGVADLSDYQGDGTRTRSEGATGPRAEPLTLPPSERGLRMSWCRGFPCGVAIASPRMVPITHRAATRRPGTTNGWMGQIRMWWPFARSAGGALPAQALGGPILLDAEDPEPRRQARLRTPRPACSAHRQPGRSADPTCLTRQAVSEAGVEPAATRCRAGRSTTLSYTDTIRLVLRGVAEPPAHANGFGFPE